VARSLRPHENAGCERIRGLKRYTEKIMTRKSLRIAATSDIHYGKHSKPEIQQLFDEASKTADVLLICGDLTDYGLPEEAHLLAADIKSHVRIPVIAVLGNHDFESQQQVEISRILEEAGVQMLDGESVEVEGVGFAGVCGFGGGFGARMLEQALSRLQTEQRVVLLHYAPIRETVEGEPLEILPFLGSSRLEGPLNRYEVKAAFHGHAHNGAPEGKTTGKVPVFNVACQVLAKLHPAKPPFRLFEVKH
jgi:Icc-related predicted phosphoesterase